MRNCSPFSHFYSLQNELFFSNHFNDSYLRNFPQIFHEWKMLIIRRHRRQHLYRYRYRHRSFSSSNIHCSSYAVNSISNKTNPKANKNQSQRIIIINLYSITLLWNLLSFSLSLNSTLFSLLYSLFESKLI